MARNAVMVGINEYQDPANNLKGCGNDVLNMRHILKTYLGFSNNDFRIVTDRRATKDEILSRLAGMVANARSGDFMVFFFSGHGGQIRDRNGDELSDGMDEILCPYDMNWDRTYILDDDLDAIFSRIPDGAVLEVFLDCCHAGAVPDGAGYRSVAPPSDGSRDRFLPPPLDIMLRHEGDEAVLANTRGFKTINRSGGRSTQNHVLWAACQEGQKSKDAVFNDVYQGAFTYFFGKHMRDTGGNITRRNLLERIRQSLRFNSYSQIPQVLCPEGAWDQNPLQIPAGDEVRRPLYLSTPYLRGEDVRQLQAGLARKGYDILADGVFGPRTRDVVRRFQHDSDLMEDGVVGATVWEALGV